MMDGQRRADKYQIDGNHYKEMALQPWELMEVLLTREELIGFLKGCVIKHSLREGKKEGSNDALKALHYKQKLAEVQGVHGARPGAQAMVLHYKQKLAEAQGN